MKYSKTKKTFLIIAIALFFICPIFVKDEGPLSFIDYLLITLDSLSASSIMAFFIIKSTMPLVKGKGKVAVVCTTAFFFLISCAEDIFYKVRNPNSVLINIFPAFIPGILLVVYVCDIKNKRLSLKTPKRIGIISALSLATAFLLFVHITSILGIA